MARTRSNSEEAELLPGASEYPAETLIEKETVDTAAGHKAEEVVVQSDVKKVRIHTSEDVDSLIGGNPYKLQKDKDYTVPSDVAAILVFSKKAYRL